MVSVCVCGQVIAEELGLPWTEVFSSLSPCPVAAASLGQVYRGRLASNGAEVAVKVGRTSLSVWSYDSMLPPGGITNTSCS